MTEEEAQVLLELVQEVYDVGPSEFTEQYNREMAFCVFCGEDYNGWYRDGNEWKNRRRNGGPQIIHGETCWMRRAAKALGETMD